MKLRKPNGQFKKATLRDFGFKDSDINTKKRKCQKCGAERLPILTTWICICGHANKGE
jgi:hypothetical protein